MLTSLILLAAMFSQPIDAATNQGPAMPYRPHPLLQEDGKMPFVVEDDGSTNPFRRESPMDIYNQHLKNEG